MKYVDGFVFAIPKRNMTQYKKFARVGRKLWLKHGALEYQECVGDDLKPAWGALFPRMTKMKRGETVIFSYIVFRSRAHRDRVNARVMKDFAALGEMMTNMPFDTKRMAYGGFKVIVGS